MDSDPVLALDTAAAQCAVAVVSGDHIVRRVERVRRGQAELLFPLIGEALAEFGADYSDLTRIVCCTGPGSFVGVRIAVSAARGLSLGLHCPAIGVTRFEALAADARGETGKQVGILLAGRGQSTFFQAFDAAGAPRAEPQILSSLDQAAFDGLDCLAGDGAPEFQDLPRVLTEGLPDPAILARLGSTRGAAERPAPLYLRPPEADLPREGPPPLLD